MDERRKVAVYTLTWDRLKYTQHAFEMLQEKAQYPYDHFVLDQGSCDGTPEWLMQNHRSIKDVRLLGQNVGNARGNNIAKMMIAASAVPYDYVIRMDNDCEVETDGIIAKLVEAMMLLEKSFSPKYMIHPVVRGINHQPQRQRQMWQGPYMFGFVGILGGLFRMSPMAAFEKYTWPENQNYVAGEESFTSWFRGKGGELLYVENIVVNHYEGTDAQAVRYPDYHSRKMAIQNSK